MRNIEVKTINQNNKHQFIEDLEKILEMNFNSVIPENYGRDKPWSLLSLLEHDGLDTYQILYVDGEFWSASGGIIRIQQEKKIYQACFRGFANPAHHIKFMGTTSYSHEFTTKYQIDRAKMLECDEVVISFNSYNEKLFNVTRDYHLPRVFGKNCWAASSEPVMFNGVPQWLLTMYL